MRSITFTSAWFLPPDEIGVPIDKRAAFEERQTVAINLLNSFVCALDYPMVVGRTNYDGDDFDVDPSREFGFRQAAHGFRIEYVQPQVDAFADRFIRTKLREVLTKVLKRTEALTNEDLEFLAEDGDMVYAHYATFWFLEISTVHQLAKIHARLGWADPLYGALGGAIDLLTS